MITQEELKSVLDYEPDTGLFRWKTQGQGRTVGMIAGSTNAGGYVRLTIRGEFYYAHRLVWLYMYGHWPEMSVDHINRCKTDNRLCNLRIASRELQAQNVESAHVRGTCYDKKRNRWQHLVPFTTHYRGHHATQEEAFAAYKELREARERAITGERIALCIGGL